MNEQNKHAALTIAQQYPPTQYNLLVPMQTVTEIADIQKPVMNSVKISTDLNDGEIYEMEKAKDEWRDSKGYVHKATPAKYALTKKGLTKLMRAAGIKILSSRPVVPSTCQKCAEVNRSIGKPIRCGGCPNKDVKHEVRISVPQLTGENVTIVAHKEIAVDDVTAGMTEKQRAEFMKFRSEMCESKALNRALRTAMQIKSSYLIEEFGKPFVVAYLVPNLDNPTVREEAVKSMFGAANDLYGSRPKPATRSMWTMTTTAMCSRSRILRPHRSTPSRSSRPRDRRSGLASSSPRRATDSRAGTATASSARPAVSRSAST